MNVGTNLEQLGTTVDHLCRHWAAKRRAAATESDRRLPTSHPFSITVSREAGTQGTAVAREVGRRLGWQVYDHELLERIAQEMHVRTALLDSVDERRQSWLLESVEAFLAAPENSQWEPFVEESAYVRHLVETVLALGVHGGCVIVGRGAAFVLPAESTLRVRLVGALKDRIATLSRNLGLPEKEAARRVRTLDRERADFIRDHFLKDPTDPTQYDLVLNAGRLGAPATAAMIVEALRHLQARAAESPASV